MLGAALAGVVGVWRRIAGADVTVGTESCVGVEEGGGAARGCVPEGVGLWVFSYVPSIEGL